VVIELTPEYQEFAVNGSNNRNPLGQYSDRCLALTA
jgi:hypothetical protein